MRTRPIVILSMVVFICIGSYACNSTQSTDDIKLVKQINEMLDKINTNPSEIMTGSFLFSSAMENYTEGIAKNCHLLIENPDIALPIMFKRLDNKKVLTTESLVIYFIVFEKTKSADSIPYIADYFESEEKSLYEVGNILSGPGAALSATQQITSLNLIDETRPFFDQRKEIADKLRKWYEEYRKKNKS